MIEDTLDDTQKFVLHVGLLPVFMAIGGCCIWYRIRKSKYDDIRGEFKKNLIENENTNSLNDHIEMSQLYSENTLQKLWNIDSKSWTLNFNNQREKFLIMIKLTQCLIINEINHYQNENDIQFIMKCDLNIDHGLILSFSVIKRYDNIEDKWRVNIFWDDENSQQLLCQWFDKGYIQEFIQFTLKWFEQSDIEPYVDNDDHLELKQEKD